MECVCGSRGECMECLDRCMECLGCLWNREKALSRKTLEVTRKQDKAKAVALQRRSKTPETRCLAGR